MNSGCLYAVFLLGVSLLCTIFILIGFVWCKTEWQLFAIGQICFFFFSKLGYLLSNLGYRLYRQQCYTKQHSTPRPDSKRNYSHTRLAPEIRLHLRFPAMCQTDEEGCYLLAFLSRLH